MIEQHEHATEGEMKVTTGKLPRVSSTVVIAHPEGKTTSPVFARKDFEVGGIHPTGRDLKPE